jgi:hypothetical protein
VESLERYLADNWKIVRGDGDTIDKKRLRQVIASGDLKHTKMTSETQTIRRYDNVALVTFAESARVAAIAPALCL